METFNNIKVLKSYFRDLKELPRDPYPIHIKGLSRLAVYIALSENTAYKIDTSIPYVSEYKGYIAWVIDKGLEDLVHGTL